MNILPALVLAVALLPGLPPDQVRVPASPSDTPALQGTPRAQAYFLFLRGGSLEMAGDVDGALKAYQEAAALDPASAEIVAEIAGLYARQDRAKEALAAADKALAIDPDNREAHRILGMIYASYAQGETSDAPFTPTEREYALKAVSHLEAVAQAPIVAEPGLLLMLGRLDMRLGSFDKAVPVLTRLRLQLGEAPDVDALLAEAEAGAGHVDQAIAILTPLASDEPRFYPVLANLYERQQRWKDAAGAYEKALAGSPGDVDLESDLAYALLNTGQAPDLARARSLLEGVAVARPADPRPLYMLAQVQRAQNDLTAAEATARRLIALAPGGLSGPLALAQVYTQRHEYRQVVETLRPVVDRLIAPGAAPAPADLGRLLLSLGEAYQELGEYDRAIETFEEAGRSDPGNRVAAAELIQAHLSARHLARAAELAQAEHEKHPDDLRVSQLYADTLRQQGQFDRAVAVMRDAVRRDTSDPGARIALAELLVSGGRADEALRDLRQAETAFPGDTSIQFEIGAVLERGKQFDEAEQAFRKVLAVDPLHAPALNYLGYVLVERGERLNEAVKYIERALTVDPGNAAYLDSLGWAYFKLNKLDLAESTLRRAAAARGTDSVIQDHFAQALFKLGRYRDAIDAWQRALAGDGQDIDRAAIESRIRAARQKVPR